MGRDIRGQPTNRQTCIAPRVRPDTRADRQPLRPHEHLRAPRQPRVWPARRAFFCGWDEGQRRLPTSFGPVPGVSGIAKVQRALPLLLLLLLLRGLAALPGLWIFRGGFACASCPFNSLHSFYVVIASVLRHRLRVPPYGHEVIFPFPCAPDSIILGT